MTVFLSLAGSLLLTLALELGLALFWRIPKRDLLLVLLANLLTNPVVVLCHTAVKLHWPAALLPATALLEITAVLVEGWLYATRGETRRPWAFSVCANLLSFTIGLLI